MHIILYIRNKYIGNALFLWIFRARVFSFAQPEGSIIIKTVQVLQSVISRVLSEGVVGLIDLFLYESVLINTWSLLYYYIISRAHIVMLTLSVVRSRIITKCVNSILLLFLLRDSVVRFPVNINSNCVADGIHNDNHILTSVSNVSKQVII